MGKILEGRDGQECLTSKTIAWAIAQRQKEHCLVA